MEKILKLLNSKPDCILVKNKSTGVFKVIDAEGDTICMSANISYAEEMFNKYSLSETRVKKEEVFRKWCKDMVEE